MPEILETRLPACKCLGIAADHGGFELKEQLAKSLRGVGYGLAAPAEASYVLWQR